MSDLLENKKETYAKGNVAGKEVAIVGHDDQLEAEGGKVEKRKADTELKTVHESFAAIFEGVNLPEDFAVKAEAVLEAAINEKVKVIESEIKESAEVRLSEIVEQLEESFTKTADKYLDFVAERWIKDNKLAVVAEAKVAKAESLVEAIQKLMAEHSIAMTEAEATELDTNRAKLAEAEARYASIANELMEAKEQTSILEARLALKEIQEGLVMTDAERLESMVEGFDVSDLERYKTKVTAVKEAHFGSEKGVIAEKAEASLEEPFNGKIEESNKMSYGMDKSLLESIKRRM